MKKIILLSIILSFFTIFNFNCGEKKVAKVESYTPGFIIDSHIHYEATDEWEKSFLEIYTKHNAMACILVRMNAIERGIKFAKEHPDRVIPYASVDIDSPTILLDIKKVYDMGYKGLGELFAKNQWNYDDPKYDPMWAYAEKLGMPIAPHTGILSVGILSRMRPGYLGTIAYKFPKLFIHAAHFGNPWYDEAAEVARRRSNLVFDISGSSLIKKDEDPAYWKQLKCCFIFFQFLVCENNFQKKITGSLSELIDAIGDDYSYVKLEDGNSILIVSPEMGGRIIGASIDGTTGKNLFWVNNSLLKGDSLGDGFISYGGHRSWIAPEDGFYFDDKGEWFVPANMDPGIYSITESNDKFVSLSNKFVIRDSKRNIFNVELKRDILINNKIPLSDYSLPDGVKFIGYNLTHYIRNLSTAVIGKDVPYIGLWSLIQVNTPGTMIIPLKMTPSSKMPYSVYKENFLPERIAHNKDCLTFKIDGRKSEKYGISPEFAGNYIAYLSTEQKIMIIKKFDIDVNGYYVDGIWNKPRDNGDVIQLYNDSGENNGGFAEMECHGPAKMLKNGESEMHSIDVYIFCGEVERLKEIGSKIMGVDLNNVVYF